MLCSPTKKNSQIQYASLLKLFRRFRRYVAKLVERFEGEAGRVGNIYLS